MVDDALGALTFTAAFIGLFHTATGPDHFLPFIALSRAGDWSLGKTMLVTTACGIGHVLSSVLLALAGLALGTAAAELVSIEQFRGNVAGWLLVGVGLAYMIWGLRRAWRNRPHAHVHAHADGSYRVVHLRLVDLLLDVRLRLERVLALPRSFLCRCNLCRCLSPRLSRLALVLLINRLAPLR